MCAESAQNPGCSIVKGASSNSLVLILILTLAPNSIHAWHAISYLNALGLSFSVLGAMSDFFWSMLWECLHHPPRGPVMLVTGGKWDSGAISLPSGLMISIGEVQWQPSMPKLSSSKPLVYVQQTTTEERPQGKPSQSHFWAQGNPETGQSDFNGLLTECCCRVPIGISDSIQDFRSPSSRIDWILHLFIFLSLISHCTHHTSVTTAISHTRVPILDGIFLSAWILVCFHVNAAWNIASWGCREYRDP